MLQEPITDSSGNKLYLVRRLPGFGADILLTSASSQVVRFEADASTLRSLADALARAAEFAERAQEG